MATVHSLKCNNCGANLTVSDQIKYFRCASCGSSLELREEGNIYYTHILEELKSDVSNIKDHTQGILIEQQILRLDRDWENLSPQLPKVSEVETMFTTIFIIIVMLMGIIAVSLSKSYPEWAIIILIVGVLALLIIFYNASYLFNQPSDYERAKRKYLTARAELLAKLNQDKKG